MKKLILLLFIPLVFQGCFSYKTVKYSQISNDKKQKIIIETIYKENIKGKLISIDEKQITLKKSSGLKTVNKEDIRFLHKCGARGYLVGTAIMKNENIEQAVRGLVNSI